MSTLTIVIVGLIATGYIFGTQWLVERLGLVRGSMIQAIGAFAIPDPYRSRLMAVGLHVLAGVLFTAAYAFVFAFVQADSISLYAKLGATIGLAHGFLISYFSVMGFSSLDEPPGVAPFTASAVALNVLCHIIFGTVVGLGMGCAALRGSVWWFAGYATTVGVVLAGICALLTSAAREHREAAQQPAPVPH